ncbi:stalk domain-containing protein [Solibacillus sp. FSL R7-0668]|uniref:stalk domain-containing protein n=1 Tax=Solibacillus sp. FSL R7-0668 TaxID=2921688 RepID=UPI0030FB4AA3
MKKIKLVFITIFILMLSVAPIFESGVSAEFSEISINVNGSDISMDDSPIIYNGTTLVPLKVLQDVLDISLSWNNSSKMLTVVKGDKSGLLKIGNPSASITMGNEKNTLNLTQPPMIINNRVMAPIRFISELFDGKITWNANTQTISITTESSSFQGSENSSGAKQDGNSNGDKQDNDATGPQGNKGDKGDAGATGPQGDKGDKGDAGAAGPQGDKGDKGGTGATGPQGDKGHKGDIGPAGSIYTNEGFSASSNNMFSNSNSFTNWSTLSPNYSSPYFDPATGIFTAPETGKYAIQATVSYKTTAPVTISLGQSIDPMFTVKSNGTTDLIKGYLPILDVNIALVLTLRTILGSATVTLGGDVELQAGDQVALYFEANGLTLVLNVDTVWSIHRLS